MFSNLKDVILKAFLVVFVSILALAVVNHLAFMLGLRPTSIIIYILFGVVLTNTVLNWYDRIANNYEDPLPKYVIDKLERKDKELQIIKEAINNIEGINLTRSEIEVLAEKHLQDQKSGGDKSDDSARTEEEKVISIKKTNK